MKPAWRAKVASKVTIGHVPTAVVAQPSVAKCFISPKIHPAPEPDLNPSISRGSPELRREISDFARGIASSNGRSPIIFPMLETSLRLAVEPALYFAACVRPRREYGWREARFLATFGLCAGTFSRGGFIPIGGMRARLG